jgi:hypothetical protein
VSFRTGVELFVNGDSKKQTLRWIYVGNAVSFYFIIRELGKAVSLSNMLSNRGFWKKFFWTFWNIADIFSIGMAYISNFIMRMSLGKDEDSTNNYWIRACLAVTTGLLWLKVLGLLKTINMQLATFVLAIVQITRDILWFLVILIAAVVCFAQIFFTLLYPEFCATVQEYDERCNPKEYYLKVYSILLGDWGLFERDDFTTAFSVTLFVLFSFMVVVVLLNVLIAIVSDSYEKCLLRSKNLFGRARVMLLAELVAFQNLLYNSSNMKMLMERGVLCFCSHRDISKGSLVFFCLTGVVLFVWIIVEYAFYKSGETYGDLKFSIGSIFVNVIILSILLFVLSNTGEIMKNTRSGWMNFNSIRELMLRILGTSEESSFSRNSSEFDDWRGRVHHLQREMERMNNENTDRTRSDMKALEYEIHQKLRKDLNLLDERLGRSEAKVTRQLKETERRLQKVVEQSLDKIFHMYTSQAEKKVNSGKIID